MHGLVALDKVGVVIRPAIIWNDGRTAEETDYLNHEIGRERVSAYTANIAFAGFTAPKLLWLAKHEPDNSKRIAKILLPKDYINYKLCGAYATDHSDASGTLLYDVAHKRWSTEMLNICHLSMAQMPQLLESWEHVGTVAPTVAAELGLPAGVTVCAGAADNAAAAIAAGVMGAGGCNISLGTSGTILMSSERFHADPNNALHAFAHADGGWYLMGCMLSAASCSQWFMEDILHSPDYAGEQANICAEALGQNRVFFLPYLMGERSPINDTDARGLFIGLSRDTSRADMLQAVFEGVAFALRDSLEAAKQRGIDISHATISGGGSASPLWTNILANVLGIHLDAPIAKDPGYGAAMLAMTACGVFRDLREAAAKLVHVQAAARPDKALAALYDAKYRQFREIYPACETLFKKLK
jgi:xylulokinase